MRATNRARRAPEHAWATVAVGSYFHVIPEHSNLAWARSFRQAMAWPNKTASGFLFASLLSYVSLELALLDSTSLPHAARDAVARPRSALPTARTGRIVHPRFSLDSPFIEAIRGFAAVQCVNCQWR